MTKDTNKSIKRFIALVVKEYQLYLLCLPALVYMIIFHFIPMYGVQIAFKDFYAIKGIGLSPWVGLKKFKQFRMLHILFL